MFDSFPGEKQVGGVAPQIRARIMDTYASLGGRKMLGQGENPMKKIPLGVIGVDSELVIDELLDDQNEASGDAHVCTGMERQKVHLLSSQVLHLRHQNESPGHKIAMVCHPHPVAIFPKLNTS